MSDTAVTPTNENVFPPTVPDGMFLDDDAPRLGSIPLVAPAPMGGGGTATPTAAPMAPPPPPVAPPVLSPPAPTSTSTEDRFFTQQQPMSQADLPTLPTAAPSGPIDTEVREPNDADDGEPLHPMAHLMPGKSKPTEASKRAAEQRAIKKAKAKRVKLAVAVCAIVVAALAGPPLVSWLTNAINETGRRVEEPAG